MLNNKISINQYSKLHPFMEYFKGLQSITHLSIDFWSIDGQRYPNVTNDFLKNIGTILPKLRVLRLRFGSIEVSQQSINSLGRLSRLESIHFWVNNNSNRNLIIDKIQKNCTKIKTINIFVEEHNTRDELNSQ